MTDWQDISTAPKDGTWVLACRAGTKISSAAYWDEDEETWLALNEAFKRTWIPTHWMPLPDPPKMELP